MPGLTVSIIFFKDRFGETSNRMDVREALTTERNRIKNG